MNLRQTRLTLQGCMFFIVLLALNFWLFRFGILAGLVGLNVSKHFLVAYLCQIVGVNRDPNSF